MTSKYTARWNLQMADRYPTWYEHMDKVCAAIAEQDRIIEAREAAGWELDEDGWLAPNPDKPNELIPELEWLDYGMLYPEEISDSPAEDASSTTPSDSKRT